MAIIDTRAALLANPTALDNFTVNQERKEFENSETFQRVLSNGQDPHIAFEVNAPPLPPETLKNRSQEIDENELLSNTEYDANLATAEQPGFLFNHAAQTVHDWYYKVGEYEDPNRAAPLNQSFLAQNPAEVSQFGLEWIGHLLYSDIGMLGGLMQSEDNIPQEVAQAQAAMMEAYDKLPSGTFKGTVRMLKNLIASPSTYFGIGSLKVLKGLLAASGKSGLKKSMHKRLLTLGLGTSAIAGEGAAWGGFADYVDQKIKHGQPEDGTPFKPNWDQVRGTAMMGGGLVSGLTLGILGAPAAYRGIKRASESMAAEGGATMRMGVGPTDTPPPTITLDEALADTRQSANVVQERLNVIVPPQARLANQATTYTPGQPDGRPWSALTDKELSQPGPGFKGADADLDRMLEEAIDESSQAAKDAVAKTGFSMTMRQGDWDAALQMPLRSQLWYELSGEAFKNRLPFLAKSDDDLIMFSDLVGVTSPREKPLNNLRRALAILSQHTRGVPLDVDLTIPEAVTKAIGRRGSGSAVEAGNKTGNFADTNALVAGAKVPTPIPVNDVWVGKIFGVTDEELMQYQSLHEPMAIFWNKMRDHVNAQGGGKFPHESWQLQSRAWVERRGAQDDYAQSFDTIVEQLRAAGVPGITKNGQITEAALRDPRFADALRPTIQPFRDAPKATIEVGTTQTPFGAEAGKVAAQLRERIAETNDPKDVKNLAEYTDIHTSALYHATRGKNPFQQAYNHVMDLPPAHKLTRMHTPRADRPYDVAGSFDGVISPNVRVPLRGMSENQVALFNAITGTGLRQDAMAASRIRVLNQRAALSTGMVEGRSIFIPTTEAIDGAKIEEFYKLLPEGFEISTDRVPNGYVIDINPRFGDDGPVGATVKDVRKAVKYLVNDGLKPEIMRHEYKSVYNEASEYPEIVAQHKEELLNGVIKELNEKFGWTEARSRRFINGRGLGKVTNDVRRKVTRIRARYQGRLSDVDEAISGYGEISDQIDQRYESWLKKQ